MEQPKTFCCIWGRKGESNKHTCLVRALISWQYAFFCIHCFLKSFFWGFVLITYWLLLLWLLVEFVSVSLDIDNWVWWSPCFEIYHEILSKCSEGLLVVSRDSINIVCQHLEVSRLIWELLLTTVLVLKVVLSWHILPQIISLGRLAQVWTRYSLRHSNSPCNFIYWWHVICTWIVLGCG